MWRHSQRETCGADPGKGKSKYNPNLAARVNKQIAEGSFIDFKNIYVEEIWKGYTNRHFPDQTRSAGDLFLLSNVIRPEKHCSDEPVE